MSRRKVALGAGIPSNWTVDVALNLANAALLSSGDPLHQIVGTDLANEPMDTGKWPVRDQGIRGACTAFAVAAAEEAWYFHQQLLTDEPAAIVPLSEEFLYSVMQEYTYKDVGICLPKEMAEELRAAGATYLLQAIAALETVGICSEELAPYNPNQEIGFYQPSFEQEINDDALKRVTKKGDFVHGIVNVKKGHIFGDEPVFRPPHIKVTTSQIFARALLAKSPVVAAFPILSMAGYSSWFGTQALQCGVVKYPPDDELANFSFTGGHTVCITGYIPGGSHDDGVFVFRNSFGAIDFGSDAMHLRCGPVPAWRGYGVLSAADVDRYCWEYMYRSHDLDGNTGNSNLL